MSNCTPLIKLRKSKKLKILELEFQILPERLDTLSVKAEEF